MTYKRSAGLGYRDQLHKRIHDIKTLPALSAVLAPLMECLGRPAGDIDLDRVVRLISYDEGIAAQCIRLTNSAMFGRRYDVETVRDSVVALGLWRVSDVVFSYAVPTMFVAFPKQVDPDIFWRHSLSCALVSQKLARIVRSLSAEKAYLAGLLHDLGILVNATLFPEEFETIMKIAADQSKPLDEVETEVLGFSHSYSGRVLAEVWKFSPDIKAAIEYHHDVASPPVAQDLVALVHLSDLLCRHRGAGYGYEEARQIDFTCSPAWLILVRNCRQMGRPHLARFGKELDEYFDEVVPLVTSILDPVIQPQRVTP